MAGLKDLPANWFDFDLIFASTVGRCDGFGRVMNFIVFVCLLLFGGLNFFRIFFFQPSNLFFFHRFLNRVIFISFLCDWLGLILILILDFSLYLSHFRLFDFLFRSRIIFLLFSHLWLVCDIYILLLWFRLSDPVPLFLNDFLKILSRFQLFDNSLASG